MSRSYYECIDLIHNGTRDIFNRYAPPKQEVARQIELASGLTECRLRMTPSGGHYRFDFAAIDFSTFVPNSDNANLHYTVLPISGFAIAQLVDHKELPKTETRKMQDDEIAQAKPLIPTGFQSVPMRRLTTTGLRRVTEDFERFKEAVLA